MRTISTTVVIGLDRVLTVQLPAEVMPGAHKVVVILERVAEEPVLSGPYPFGPVDPNDTFRREDLYGDDGR